VQEPEDEDEKDKKRKKRGYVVHRPQHDDQLIAKSWQESYNLQYPQQTERP